MLKAGIPGSREHAPPHLTASLTPDDGGVVLEGTIRESWAEASKPYVFFGLAAWVALLTLLGVSGGSLMVLVMLLPAVVFAGLGHWMRRGRASQFDSDCRVLLDAVTGLLRPRR